MKANLSTYKMTSLEILKYHFGLTFRARRFKTQLAELLKIHVQKYIWNLTRTFTVNEKVHYEFTYTSLLISSTLCMKFPICTRPAWVALKFYHPERKPVPYSGTNL